MKEANAQNVESKTATITGLVDSANLTELHKKSLQGNKEQTIVGQYTFKNVSTVTGDVLIEDSLNDIEMDKVLTTSTRQNITGNLTFHDEVTISNNVELHQFTLNGIGANSMMTKDGEQTVTGRKKYKSPVEFKNVQLSGLLNGIDIADFANSKVSISRSELVTGHLTFLNGYTVNSDIVVEGMVDGVNITALAESLNSDENEDEVVSGK